MLSSSRRSPAGMTGLSLVFAAAAVAYAASAVGAIALSSSMSTQSKPESSATTPPPAKAAAPAVASFYDLKAAALDGKPADLGSYKGKVTLVVNVASKCGYTPQYDGLEKLHKELAPKGFAVLGFPSNDFGGQEPGTAAEIQEFCKLTYGVTFPMFEKSVTKAGPTQSPIYAYLGQTGNLPAWNFSKYLIGKDGKVIAFYPSKVKPDAPELRDAIAKALAN
jgi:glutathione peroxidase